MCAPIYQADKLGVQGKKVNKLGDLEVIFHHLTHPKRKQKIEEKKSKRSYLL